MELHESKTIPMASIRVEDGADELAHSQKMAPYLSILKAQISGQELAPLLDALRTLPLEERYVWRVTAALKWAFCDLDTESIIADLRTLSAADLKRLVEPLRLRTLQFSIFILSMLGSEAGERLILQALDSAKESHSTDPSE